ncbi:MAG: glutathione peroxidase [Marinilabiliales bacterium]|nr:MAG: glutathione peroxidase [Marinilabiliales bacterium]
MKRISVIVTTLFLSALVTNAQSETTLHDFVVEDIYGDTFDLADLNGKKVLVVNTASKCGLTPQYEGLQELYEEFGGDDFIIIGFPANNFANQEPGTNEEIAQFCQMNYGVSFPMMSKISVKGDDIHPLYQWLTQKSHNGVVDAEVTWNFQKFMVDENGRVVDYAAPRENPRSEKILNWIASGS